MTSFTHGYHDSGPFHSPQALAWGDSAPESGKPFKWFSRVGDNEDPKLKLGENEKGRLQQAREKTNCKGCHDNEQCSDNPRNTATTMRSTLKGLGGWRTLSGLMII
jgi:hypothetical protein